MGAEVCTCGDCGTRMDHERPTRGHDEWGVQDQPTLNVDHARGYFGGRVFRRGVGRGRGRGRRKKERQHYKHQG